MYACYHLFDLENLGCGSKKKKLPGYWSNFQKSIDQNQSFFPGHTISLIFFQRNIPKSLFKHVYLNSIEVNFQMLIGQ